MKNLLAVFFAVALLWSVSVSGQNLALLNMAPIPKTIAASNALVIQSAVVENLNDLNDITKLIYMRPQNVERWINILIDEGNATSEADYVNAINAGKKPAPAKKNLPVSLAAIGPVVLKTISGYVKLDSVLNVYFTPVAGGTSIGFVLQDNLGKQLGAATVILLNADLKNRAKINMLVKETLVTLHGLWPKYYYAQKKTGGLVLAVTPLNASIMIPSLGKMMKNNIKEDVASGWYQVVITASNFAAKVTNLQVTDKLSPYRINLVKFIVKPEEIGKPATGRLYIDSDSPGAAFLIIETGTMGTTPMLVTNLPLGSKTVVFDETANYSLKKLQLSVRENITTYEFVKLAKTGTGLKVECSVDGASVIIDKESVGTISEGTFQTLPSEGMHSLTVIKDLYEPYRTNITIAKDSLKTMKVTLIPKKVLGYFVTPQATGVALTVGSEKVGTTPYLAAFKEADKLTVGFQANPNGYISSTTNISWKWNLENNLVIKFKPLYGELKINVLNPGLTNVALFVENAYRGRVGVNGFSIAQLLARPTKIRLEQEGYRTLSTNLLVNANVSSPYAFMMKESPVKAFITTYPEKDFEVVINDAYVGLSGSGALPMELGKVQLKLKKRGFKTIYTNLDVLTKDALIIKFASEPGIGEDEFFEALDEEMAKAKRFSDNSSAASALPLYQAIHKNIKTSDYAALPRSVEQLKLVEAKMLQLDAASRGDDLMDKLNRNLDQAENMTMSKKYSEAIAVYNSSLLLIDQSGLTDDSKIKELRSRVVNGLSAVQKRDKVQNSYWQKNKRAWNGFSFSIMGSDLAKDWNGVFQGSRANPMVWVRPGINILPILGISLGGLYNFNYKGMPRENAFVDAAFTFGGNLRIPINPQWSVYGDYQLLMDDFVKVDVLDKNILNTGVEIKWGGISLKVFYEMGFKSHFKETYQGFGIGTSFWAQGD